MKISLLAESVCNTIKTEGNLGKESNIKKVIQSIFDNKHSILEAIHNIEANFNFEEIGTDLINSVLDNYDNENKLIENGFIQTTQNSYSSETFRTLSKEIEIPYLKNFSSQFIEYIEINCAEATKILNFFHQDNFILFYKEGDMKHEYFYECQDVKIIDFKIDSNWFVHILFNEGDSTYYARTHLSRPFLPLNESGELNKKELFCLIKIKSSENQSIKIAKHNYIITSDLNNNFTKHEFCKKYYFQYNGKLYFNEENIFEEEEIIDKELQLNFLDMYNYINFLGLNEFLIDGYRKISTKENEIFKNIFINRFDNTINGGLNFFDTRYKNKTYKVSINDDFYSVNGNFIFDFKKGKYEIVIDGLECSLNLIDGDDKKYIKKIKIPNVNVFYFCNLKFEKKKFSYNAPVKYVVEVDDNYSFSINKHEKYELEAIPSSKLINDVFLENTNINPSAFFDGNKIVFENFYDFKNNKFKYASVSIEVKHGDKFPKEKASVYFFKGSCYEDERFIHFRERGSFTYSEFSEISFELINKKGYITNFWIENQDKTVYFKNENGTIKITEKGNDFDFYCYIPKISDFENRTEKSFKDIYVVDNDDLEVSVPYSEKTIITEKFMNTPLFYKIYIEEEINETFELYNSDDVKVTEYMHSKYKNGYLVYFNAEPNKKYYYNLNDGKYIYSPVMKAHENIYESYAFDKNKEIILDNEVNIKTFSLSSDSYKNQNDIFELFLYNTNKKEVTKIELYGRELNKEFELNITVDKIVLGYSGSSDGLNFEIIDLISFVDNNQINFLKNQRVNQVFVSTEIDNSDIKVDHSLIKVNTRYNIEKGIKEDNKGTFYINKPIPYEISIYKRDSYLIYTKKSIAVSAYYDKFYEENFKALGLKYVSKPSDFRKIFETNNYHFELGGQNE